MLFTYAIPMITLVLSALSRGCPPVEGTIVDDDDDIICDVAGFISPRCADDLGGVKMLFSSPI